MGRRESTTWWLVTTPTAAAADVLTEAGQGCTHLCDGSMTSIDHVLVSASLASRHRRSPYGRFAGKEIEVEVVVVHREQKSGCGKSKEKLLKNHFSHFSYKKYPKLAFHKKYIWEEKESRIYSIWKLKSRFLYFGKQLSFVRNSRSYTTDWSWVIITVNWGWIVSPWIQHQYGWSSN